VENKLVITMVLYRTEFSQTPSYEIIKKAIKKNKSVYLFVYDNSEKIQDNKFFHRENVLYIHDKTNPGLAEAYNKGSLYLKKIQGDLLLLLDQDTLLDDTYIETLLNLKVNQAIGAYVPIIHSHGRQISPVFSDQYIGRDSKLPKVGVYSEPIMGINSGTAISKEMLDKIAPFNTAFPLDFLDHWLFWEIRNLNKKISVLDHQLMHDLSVLNYETVSSQRYESIIRAETLFYQKYDQDKFYTHRRHLFLRAVKQFLFVKNRNIWRRTFLEYRTLMKGK